MTIQCVRASVASREREPRVQRAVRGQTVRISERELDADVTAGTLLQRCGHARERVMGAVSELFHVRQ